MVAIFKAEDQQQISAALDKAKEHTGVEVSLLVVRASDRYLDLIFINAVFVILVVDAILYYSELVTTYGILFGIAVGGICGSILPFVRRYLIGLLPRSVRYHHAARHAV
ncbi:MAG TPA: hypothetical protein VFR09_00745, partial [Alphaproteobacteria bacterium]|nr:hypothetical protein [Alphaproteobacteria bacterium]